MKPVLNITGQYYESIEPMTDPDGYNDATFKKKEPQEGKIMENIDRSVIQFNDVWNKINGSQRFNSAIQDAQGTYKEVYQQINISIETLKDLINGCVIGHSELQKQQLSEYMIEIAQMEQDLAKIDLKLQEPILNKINKSQIQQLLKDQQNQEEDENSITLNLVNEDETKLQDIEKRIANLQLKVGLQNLKKNGESQYFYKGQLFINQYDSRGNRDKIDSFNQYTHIDPMNIVSHINSMKTQISLLKCDESAIQKVQKIQESLDTQKNDKSQQEFVNTFTKTYETSLKGLEEIPHLVQRLQTLQALHNKTLDLPIQMDLTSQMLEIMDEELNQSQQILDTIENKIK
ncbi:hypothetical protein pb186bvf_000965 [Paramecium bursaria]